MPKPQEPQVYTATIQILGFVDVEVTATSAKQAKKILEKGNLANHIVGKLQSPVFQSYESEPTPEQ